MKKPLSADSLTFRGQWVVNKSDMPRFWARQLTGGYVLNTSPSPGAWVAVG